MTEEKLRTYRIFFKNGHAVNIRATNLATGVRFDQYAFIVNGEDAVYVPQSEVLYIVPMDMIGAPGGPTGETS